MQQATYKSTGEAFSDRRVYFVRPGDPRLARVWPQTGGFEQSEDGPTYVVIGSDTDDAACQKLAQRFYHKKSRLSAADLIAFRDDKSIKEMSMEPDALSGRLVRACGIYID